MKTLWFDAFSGASGDMLLGALVDLGGRFRELERALAHLAKGRFVLKRRRVLRSGVAATKIDVRVTGRDREERGFREIASLVRRAGLPAPARELSIEIFRRLCEAEAAVHGTTLERVHLHEAGAIDALADVCGTAWLLSSVGADRVLCSPLNVGSGTIVCRHGTYPVPGPATARLLRGAPVYAEGSPGERVTPTGAAILSTVVSGFGPLPLMRSIATGQGAGDRDFGDRPNVLRAFLGVQEAAAEPGAGGGEGRESAEVLVLETTIDDMNPQNYAWLVERALAEGALDVHLAPIVMKKGRPGIGVTALVTAERFEALAKVLFRETTTIGFRWRREARRELERRIESAGTPWGPVRLKVSSWAGEVMQVQPEYEDCRRLAARTGVPLKEIQRAALAGWKALGGPPRTAARPRERARNAARRPRARSGGRR